MYFKQGKPNLLKSNFISAHITDYKGWAKKTRTAKTLKCSKSKIWIPRKLKLHQPVHLIR